MTAEIIKAPADCSRALEALLGLRDKFAGRAEGYREGQYEAIMGTYVLRQEAEANPQIQRPLVQQCVGNAKPKVNQAKFTLVLTKFVFGGSSRRDAQRCSKIARVIDYFRSLQLSADQCW